MRNVRLPDGWAPNTLTFFFEDEDLSGEERPFAANVVFHLRTDVGAEDDPKNVARLDIATLERVLPSVTVERQGELELGGKKRHHHELLLDDGDRPLRQLSVYTSDEGRMYTFTATHVAERFDNTRSQMLEIATTLLDASRSDKS